MERAINNSNRGFTLLEVLVAASIFAIVMTAASGIFAAAIRDQDRILKRQMAISNTSYALEYMSRSLRMAKKDLDGDCLTGNYSTGGETCNYKTNSDNTAIRFLNHNKKCVQFYEEGGQIKIKKSATTTDTFSGGHPFTSDKFDISKLKFKLKGACQSDNFQPSVTIMLRARIDDQTSFNTQTTVTQRNLDVAR